MQSAKRDQRPPRLFAALLLLLSVWSLHAQPASTNRVLELDGNGSYVELPANIFNDLKEATVEGWFKWESWQASATIFDFGRDGQEMVVQRVPPQSIAELANPRAAGRGASGAGWLVAIGSHSAEGTCWREGFTDGTCPPC
jgi:hypothetical protein